MVKRLAVLGAALMCLVLPAAAWGHATVEGTSPLSGQTVKREPALIEFRFTEPVEGNFGAIRVYDSKSRRVESGDSFHPSGTGAHLAVKLKPGLPDGTYTATYRVISADSHPVSGGFVFNIGDAGAAPAESVADLLQGSTAGPATEIAFGIARGLDYLAIALALGGLGFLFLT